MRKQLVKTVTELTDRDNRVVTLLGDIGVWGFHELMEKYPNRVYNIGILEQSTLSLASGLSLTGLIPIVHTISPFIVERAYEQLKLDFGYQQVNGNFIGVGASYDYSKLGTTHYCPADISILKSIPNMEIVVPGCAEEFGSLLSAQYQSPYPTYYRLSEYSNKQAYDITFGKAIFIKGGGVWEQLLQ